MANSLKNELRKTLETMRLSDEDKQNLFGGQVSELSCRDCTQRGATCKNFCTYCIGLCENTCSICMNGSAC